MISTGHNYRSLKSGTRYRLAKQPRAARNWRLWSIDPYSYPQPGEIEEPFWSPSCKVALYQKGGAWQDRKAEGRYAQSIEQDTLAALVETGAAREFRVLREGEAWSYASE